MCMKIGGENTFVVMSSISECLTSNLFSFILFYLKNHEFHNKGNNKNVKMPLWPKYMIL